MPTPIARSLLLAALLTGSVQADTLKPEDQIRYRQAGYAFMAWNMGKIKAMTVDDPSSYDQAQVAAAARAIAAVANSGMGALYSPASARSIGAVRTRVKPEFFQQPDEVRKVAIAFATEANALAKVAEGDNADAIQAQFGRTGRACKACHEKFREK